MLGRAFHPLVVAIVAITATAPAARAVTSSASVGSSFGGNGFNVSFDGRLYIVSDNGRWAAVLLRPEAITFGPGGLPDAAGPMWSGRVNLRPGGGVVENAVAICEADPARAPYRCDDAGSQTADGPFDCYDLWLIDSNADLSVEDGGYMFRRRRMTLWVQDPRTGGASIHKFDLPLAFEMMTPTLYGIEPTITADGRLLVWQGHPDNDAKTDTLVYSVAPSPCAAAGWSAPRPLSDMAIDPAVVGRYRLGERTLRAADGTAFQPGDLVYGAYPWLMANGDAVVLQASNLACGPSDPSACSPRRNSFAVLGYPTNWGIAIVDGAANPSFVDSSRLFFGSPGPRTFPQLPVTPGADVWPFFGSNTGNYVELVFDDGLDGHYAGLWHFNESVTHGGALDITHVPDVSGYFNTGALEGGLLVAPANNGALGRALAFDGVDDRVTVPHSITLNPINGVTLDFWIRPTAEPDCDGNNNYRVVLAKGGISDGPFSVVFEESHALQVRFRIDGEAHSIATPAVAMDVWTHVSCEWDGGSGRAGCWFGDQEVAAATLPAGRLSGSTAPLTIGAPGPRAACPAGDGAFAGLIDELAISRYARRLGSPADDAPDAGPGGDGDGGNGGGPGSTADGGPDDANRHGIGGCGCHTGGGAPAAWLAIVAAFAIAIGRWRRPARAAGHRPTR